MRQISKPFAALLDANVLYPFLVRDVLLSLAEAGLYRPLWTDAINAEWSKRLIENTPDKAAKINATILTMNRAFPEAIVDHYADLIPGLDLPDPNDRHVLAAAIRGAANVIVTENTRDFPARILGEYDLETRSTDEFMANISELHPADAVAALKTMRGRYNNPGLSADELLQAMLRCGLVATVAWLTPYRVSL